MLGTTGTFKLKGLLQSLHTEVFALNDFAALVAEELPSGELAPDDLAQTTTYTALTVTENADDYADTYPHLVHFLRTQGDMCHLAACLSEAMEAKATDPEILDFAETYSDISQIFFGKP